MNSPNLNLKPFIYDFHDVREFLTSWLDWKRKNQKSFSMRRWARESGISVGFLPLMFSRKRILTEKILNQLMPSLKLRSEEQIYLKNLRVLSESTSLDEKSKALNQMQKAKKYKNLNSKNLEAYKYLTNWLHVAIREMTALNGFKLDEKWIQSKLKKKVPASKIKRQSNFSSIMSL